SRLNDEAVFAANVFKNLKIELAVREATHLGLSDLDAQVMADLFSERPIRVSGKDLDIHAASTRSRMEDRRSRIDHRFSIIYPRSSDLAGEGGFEPPNGGSK